MGKLGELERAVMEYLWSCPQPQTVRQVYNALSLHREIAYTTVMTVMQRLAKKKLLAQQKTVKAHTFYPQQQREELVAELMADALAQADPGPVRQAALLRFLSHVSDHEVAALRTALQSLEPPETL